MTQLSVNVNKIATLRNARGGNLPDVLRTALDIERFGAEGITVHPRPDERHIRRSDVYAIAGKIRVEFNIEGYPAPDYLALVEEIRPTQATLVPDAPDVLTSNAGWRVWEHLDFLRDTVRRLHQTGARVSLFVDPFDYLDREVDDITASGADRIELYTEAYAKAFGTPRQAEITEVYRRLAAKATAAGLGLNAGHDLNLDNLGYLLTVIPAIAEVSIGHALICDALYHGLEKTVGLYLAAVKQI